MLKEYLTLEHTERVPTSELSLPVHDTYYLPVHGVVKETSSTTRLRAVFDASAKLRPGISLNVTLLSGPNVYSLLITVFMRFRTHLVASLSDVSKIFREVDLNPEEWDFHRFLMRDDEGTLHDC